MLPVHKIFFTNFQTWLVTKKCIKLATKLITGHCVNEPQYNLFVISQFIPSIKTYFHYHIQFLFPNDPTVIEETESNLNE